MTFNKESMRQYLGEESLRSVLRAIDGDGKIDRKAADEIALSDEIMGHLKRSNTLYTLVSASHRQFC